MDNDTKNLIKQRLSELPPEIGQTIRNTDLSVKFEEIAKKHGLLLDQNGALQTETLLVMLGLEESSDYVENIKTEVGVSPEEAAALAEEVNQTIFSSIKDSIRKIEEQQEKDSAEEKARAGAQEWINKVISPNKVMTSTDSAPVPARPAPSSTLTSTSTSTQTPAQTAPTATKVIPLKPIPAKIPIAPIEKAGGFTVTKPTPSSSIYNDSNLKREDVLADLENIKHLKPENAENFVEHLLESPAPAEPAPKPAPVQTPPPVQIPVTQPEPIKAPEPKVEVKVEPKPAPQPAPQPAPRKYEADPYREAI